MRLTLIVCALALAGCMDTESGRPLKQGDRAPAYAAPVLDGDTLTLESLRGTTVLLNVWATWCAPCRDEMPGLQTLHERYGARGLRVLGVSIDTRGAEDAVRSFAADRGITFTILHDANETVSRQFRTRAVPETFLIGADGNVLMRWIGKIDPLSPDVIDRVELALTPK